MRTERSIGRKKICLVLVLAVLLLSTFLISPAFALQQPEKKVLLLHSYHEGMVWSDEVTEGVRTVFERTEPPIDLYIEYMDVPRLGTGDYMDQEADALRQKYADTTFDLVICSDDYAFHFMRDRHASLFPGVPTVFCGVNFFEDAELDGWGNCTGIVEAYDVGGTLEAALALDPGVKNVYVVNDATETGVSNMRILRGAAEHYTGRLTFAYSGNASLDEIEKTVEDLPGDTIVLLMTYYRDPGGSSYYDRYADIARIVSAASAVPVYGVWDFYLGHGIVGGRIVSGQDQGEAAAHDALRILGGEPVSQIPVEKDLQGRYIFDYVQLQRYGFDASDLPEGSTLINAPPQSLQIDRSVVVAVGFTVFILVLIVGFLLYGIRARKKGEEILRKSEEKFRGIAENAFDVIYSMDLEGRFTYLSPSMLRVSGYEPAEFLGRSFKDMILPGDSARSSVAFSTAASGGTIEGMEIPFKRKDGRVAYIEINTAPVRENGRIVGFQGVVRDITERKEMELMKAEAFAQIDRNIEQFATLGDEIRNPLAVIVGIADLHCDDENAEKIFEQAGIIDRIITRLDKGWIESGKVREFLRKH